MGDGQASASEDHAEGVQRELMLLDPAVRADPRKVRELLHPEFLEFGASGRRWDLEAVAEALAADPALPSAEATELAAVDLSRDVVLLTY
jgi:ribonuclease HI